MLSPEKQRGLGALGILFSIIIILAFLILALIGIGAEIYDRIP